MIQTAEDDEGLSPLAQGNLLALEVHLHHDRPIPACAGEPFMAEYPMFACRAYPRLRGGTRSVLGLLSEEQGLSPLAQGNLLVACLVIRISGPIPACAGESSQRTFVQFVRWAYPHSSRETFRN